MKNFRMKCQVKGITDIFIVAALSIVFYELEKWCRCMVHNLVYVTKKNDELLAAQSVQKLLKKSI